MMKQLLFTAIVAIGAATTFAQDAEVKRLKDESNKTIKKEPEQKEGWTKGGVFNLNLSQGASKNWAAGAEKFSFSVNALANTFAYYKKGRNAWDNTLNVQYGIVNATSIGTRKNDDRIDLLSRYGYQLGDTAKSRWYVSALVNLRTQMTTGYNYTVEPKEKNSNFFAPAYLLVSPGILYKPNAAFDVFLSPVTSRWVIVNAANKDIRRLFNFTDTTKGSINEIGAFLTANLKKDLAKNISLTSRLDLFSNYKNNPQNIDVFWTNTLGFKVNKYIGVSYNFDLIYDHDVKNVKTGGLLGTQLKSLLGIGFTATF
ncbi:Protein of unknown function (DUF3078) [Lacibacter cauensis]|uniref:DUF3078 family protein n=1 Tax=Lacibacter cauensis TaxID=510947 RepID=A0A562SR55_9BACT|nr:DUF3078 domain-containing protein [Lacibacter cauensis]TWI83613.1 Protein of unknown function (DUF3078) [Lacibacter cauensis]